MSIYKKLHTIQASVTALKKNAKGHGYEYLNGDKLLDHIKPHMDSLGLILKQEVLSIENERMDYKTGVGTNYEKPKSEILSKVMMRFTWVDVDSGEMDVNLFGANGQNDWDKGVGSALTYGERYFLLKYFHIATDEDDVDNPARKKEEKEPSQPAAKPAPAKATTPAKATPPADDKSAAYDALAIIGAYTDMFNACIEEEYLTEEQKKVCTPTAAWNEEKYRKAYNWLLPLKEKWDAAANVAKEEKAQAVKNVRMQS